MAWWNHSIEYRNQKRSGRFKRIELDIEKLKSMYHSGATTKDLTEHFNCSSATIKRHLRFLIPLALRKYKQNYSKSNPVNQLIIDLYASRKLSTKSVANKVGLSDETVRRRLKRFGIDRRTRAFKDLSSFHPASLNRNPDKNYPFNDIESFNRILINSYCMMLPQCKIADILNIDRATASRRINFMRNSHYFKMRFCKRCNELFRFVADNQRTSSVCMNCRKDEKNLMELQIENLAIEHSELF